MACEEHPDDHGAQIALESDRLEQRVARYQCHHHAEEHLEFVVRDSLPDAAQQPGEWDEPHERECPRARCPVGGDAEEHDCCGVLHHQDADGDPAVERLRLASVIEDLDDEHGRGEGEGEPDDGERPQVGSRGEAEPEQCQAGCEYRTKGDTRCHVH